MRRYAIAAIAALTLCSCQSVPEGARDNCIGEFGKLTYPAAEAQPVDSTLKVKTGEAAPDFALPAVSGETTKLSDYRGRKNVVLTFVPAAWTPVCSAQWPAYDLMQQEFEKYDAAVLGISTDNVPTLYAWEKAMQGLWFPVLSDFWPHGGLADRYGVLRSDGTAERALFVIDKQGVIRYIDVHDVNARPDMQILFNELAKLEK